MKVNMTKQEAKELFDRTGKLKYKILSKMVDWTTDPKYFRNLVKQAEREYNELRSFAGENYPVGKCDNIIELFNILKKEK